MLPTLRKHRRPLSSAVLVALLVWLSVTFAGCLVPLTQSLSDLATAAVAHSRSPGTMHDRMPCPPGECALMQSERPLAAGNEIAPTAPKPLLAALILAVVLLSVADRRRDGPRAPDPLLPRRPPFLRFYALRI